VTQGVARGTTPLFSSLLLTSEMDSEQNRELRHPATPCDTQFRCC
jgi:hypothetical protein